MGDVGEHVLVDKIARLIGEKKMSHVEVGIGDDAAIVRLKGRRTVLTSDALVEDVDFTWRWASATDVGHKAAAANLSDLAAMGARPRALLASLCLPHTYFLSDALAIMRAMHRVGCAFGAPVVGGDISSIDGKAVISVSAMGEVAHQPLKRHAARVGDVVAVTGPLGHAAAGLAGLMQNDEAKGVPPVFRRAQLRPTPHIDAGLCLSAQTGVTACCDVSDGLAKDVMQLVPDAMGVTLCSKAWASSPKLLRYAQDMGVDARVWPLYGGEDFVLAVSVRACEFAHVQKKLAYAGYRLRAIGVVTNQKGLRFASDDTGAPPIAASAFEHFRGH